jgi:hypothetical protein
MITSCGGHLGDVLWPLQMLTVIPGKHTIGVLPEYIPQLRELVPEVEFVTAVEGLGKDMWIANGRFGQQGLHYTGQIRIMDFVMDFLNAHCREEGVEAPYRSTHDMLWRCPSILEPVPVKPFDILVVNCDPLSGQAPNYSRSQVDGLLLQLVAKGHRVLCTNATNAAPWGNFTIREIANLSTRAKCILGVASGPVFPTFNIWTSHIPHYIWLDPMRLSFGDTKIRHAANAEQMRVTLTEDGWL